MSISVKLKKFLDDNNVKYLTITHSRAYTAQGIASALHCPGKEMAKSVIVKKNGTYAMVVLSASENINFNKLKQELGTSEVELATEEEFKGLFPECEVGAMPVLGNLYGLPVYCSKRIVEDDDIYFNAGSHSIAVKLATKDFLKLVNPKVLSYS